MAAIRDTPDSPAILIATHDAPYGLTLERFLAGDAARIERCIDAPGLLRLAARRPYAVLVLDLDLPGQGDIDVLSFVRQRAPDTRLILLFDPAQIERALDGLRRGAYFYLPHSSPPSDVALVVRKALRSRQTESAVARFEQEAFEDLVGRTGAMQRVIEVVRKVAPTDSTVLLLGESGTGKEVLANTLHRLSRRRQAPFVAINCAALPEALLESEMFGHVKGAFTGAERDKPGLFEEADGGTIFLDEIGDMALLTQAKLLRVLQSGEIRPVGATTAKRVDVRVVAATHRDLQGAAAEGRFREDLYFRLNVIQVRIPPLRERIEALATLLPHFIARSNAQHGRSVRGIDEHAAALLRHYHYPGNVRELESIVAHAVIMADGDTIRAQDLPDPVRFGGPPRLALPYNAPPLATLAEAERAHIVRVLEASNGNQTQAAKTLGISRSTLWRKMNEYRLGA